MLSYELLSILDTSYGEGRRTPLELTLHRQRCVERWVRREMLQLMAMNHTCVSS